MKSTTLRASLLVAALSVATAGLTACGSDDEPTAEEQACAARDDLSQAVQTVTDDLKSANLGDAKDSAADISPALDNLSSALSDLGAEEREKLQPQADQISAELDGLGDASSLSDLQSIISSVGTQISTLVGDIKTDLDCSE